jgi:hypothetical protein
MDWLADEPFGTMSWTDIANRTKNKVDELNELNEVCSAEVVEICLFIKHSLFRLGAQIPPFCNDEFDNYLEYIDSLTLQITTSNILEFEESDHEFLKELFKITNDILDIINRHRFSDMFNRTDFTSFFDNYTNSMDDIDILFHYKQSCNFKCINDFIRAELNGLMIDPNSTYDHRKTFRIESECSLNNNYSNMYFTVHQHERLELMTLTLSPRVKRKTTNIGMSLQNIVKRKKLKKRFVQTGLETDGKKGLQWLAFQVIHFCKTGYMKPKKVSKVLRTFYNNFIETRKNLIVSYKYVSYVLPFICVLLQYIEKFLTSPKKINIRYLNSLVYDVFDKAYEILNMIKPSEYMIFVDKRSIEVAKSYFNDMMLHINIFLDSKQNCQKWSKCVDLSILCSKLHILCRQHDMETFIFTTEIRNKYSVKYKNKVPHLWENFVAHKTYPLWKNKFTICPTKEEIFAKNPNKDCGICLCPLEYTRMTRYWDDNEDWVSLSSCDHIFCDGCINQWFNPYDDQPR